jgi:acetoin utilization protein AcuB
MRVRDVMQSNVVTAAPETPLSEVARLMSQYRIRHLPVVAGTRLLGLISDRDLKASAVSLGMGRQGNALEAPDRQLTAADLLRATVFTIGSLAPAEDAARLLAEHRIGSLPVVDQGRFVGIVTDTDLLACFSRVVVGGEPSTRVEIVLPSPRSPLAEVVRILEDVGFRLRSVIVLSGGGGPAQAVVRVDALDAAAAVGALRAAGYAARLVDGPGAAS